MGRVARQLRQDNLVRRLRRRALIERDLASLRRRREIFEPPETDPSRVALVVSLTEFVYQLKLESMLAQAVMLKGLTPVVLTQPGSWVPRRYFEAFGIRRLVSLAEFEDAAPEQEVARATAELSARATDAAALKALTYRGVPIGRQLFSTISRMLHAGAPDLADPAARRMLDQLLPRSVRATFAGETLLERVQPELLLFIERNYSVEAPLSDVALDRGVNVVQFVSAFQDDALVFKRYSAETRGMHPRSLSDESWRRVVALDWTERHERELADEFDRRYGNVYALNRRTQDWTRPYSREEVIRSLRLDPDKRTAVIFSHLLWDANMFYGRDLFGDQEEWFVETVRAACANDRVNWIVKLHPANVWKLRRDGVGGELTELEVLRSRIGDIPSHVHVLNADAEISTRSIFDVADWGITIRGSVGFELPCFGTAALTAGTGFYASRGFTVDSATPREYLGRLAAIEEIPPPTEHAVELARRHAWALFFARPTRFTSFESVIRPVDEVGHVLDHDVRVLLTSRRELERAGDLRAFADWAVDSRELDYLDLGGEER